MHYDLFVQQVSFLFLLNLNKYHTELLFKL